MKILSKCGGRGREALMPSASRQCCIGPYCALGELEKAPLAQDILLPSAGKLSYKVLTLLFIRHTLDSHYLVFWNSDFTAY